MGVKVRASVFGVVFRVSGLCFRIVFFVLQFLGMRVRFKRLGTGMRYEGSIQKIGYAV